MIMYKYQYLRMQLTSQIKSEEETKLLFNVFFILKFNSSTNILFYIKE
jgi:hypothetical protein